MSEQGKKNGANGAPLPGPPSPGGTGSFITSPLRRRGDPPRQRDPLHRRHGLRRQGRALDAARIAIRMSGKVFVLVRPAPAPPPRRASSRRSRLAEPFDPLRERARRRFRRVHAGECVAVRRRRIGARSATSPRRSRAARAARRVSTAPGSSSFNPSLERALASTPWARKNALECAAATGARSCTCPPASSRATATATFRRRADRRLLPAPTMARDWRRERALDRRLRPRSRDRRLQTLDRPGARSRPTTRARLEFRDAARAEPRRRAAATATTKADARSPSRASADLDDRRARRSSAWSAPGTGAGPTPTRTRRASASRSSPRAGVPVTIVRPADRRDVAALSVPGLERRLQHDRAAGVPVLRARAYPMGERSTLDIVPVDLVAAGRCRRRRGAGAARCGRRADGGSSSSARATRTRCYGRRRRARGAATTPALLPGARGGQAGS